jgi:hypothetical protein
MRALLAVIVLLSSWAFAHAADPPKLAVFDFEMIDTSLQGEMNGKRSDEQERLKKTGDQVRGELGESGFSTSRRSMLRRIRTICRHVVAVMPSWQSSSAPISTSPAPCRRCRTSFST